MTKAKYGFVYIWYDRKYKRYYVGCHYGSVDDGYVCSSKWMYMSHKRRPEDFKRRVIKTNLTREGMYAEEQRYLSMIKEDEIKPKNPNPRYYNLCLSSKDPWHKHPDKVLTIGQKISKAKKGKKTGPAPERGAAISAAKKGKSFSEEHKTSLSEAAKTRKLSPEGRAKRCAAMQKAWAPGGKRRQKLNITV
jgi:hypothetical protein